MMMMRGKTAYHFVFLPRGHLSAADPKHLALSSIALRSIFSPEVARRARTPLLLPWLHFHLCNCGNFFVNAFSLMIQVAVKKRKLKAIKLEDTHSQFADCNSILSWRALLFSLSPSLLTTFELGLNCTKCLLMAFRIWAAQQRTLSRVKGHSRQPLELQ